MQIEPRWDHLMLMSLPYTGMSLLYGMRNGFDIRTLLILVLVLAISLSFHEMAHAWSANRLGDDTAAMQGRLTMNPAAHLDPIGSIVFLLAGIGWAKPEHISYVLLLTNFSIIPLCLTASKHISSV